MTYRLRCIQISAIKKPVTSAIQARMNCGELHACNFTSNFSFMENDFDPSSMDNFLWFDPKQAIASSLRLKKE